MSRCRPGRACKCSAAECQARPTAFLSPTFITLFLNQIYHLYPNPAMAYTFCVRRGPFHRSGSILIPPDECLTRRAIRKRCAEITLFASRVLLPCRRLLPFRTDVLSTDIRLSKPQRYPPTRTNQNEGRVVSVP